MRISVLPKDKGYRPDATRFKVTLDGKRQDDAVTADDDIGMIVRYQRNSVGWLVVDPHGSGKLMTEKVYGVVKIDRAA
jgi:hypothetical protein